MKDKNFFRTIDYAIIAVIIIIAAAMSGISLRFTLSLIDNASQTNTLVPSNPNNPKQTLQINSLEIQTSQESPPGQIPFECPVKSSNLESSDNTNTVKQKFIFE